MAYDVDDLPTRSMGQSSQLFEMFLSDTFIEGLQRRPDEYGPIHVHLIIDQLGRNTASLCDTTLRLRRGGYVSGY